MGALSTCTGPGSCLAGASFWFCFAQINPHNFNESMSCPLTRVHGAFSFVPGGIYFFCLCSCVCLLLSCSVSPVEL